ncbi:hypothetical protein [Sulfurirhabdus autotrophica]|uniref:DUF2946 domain-containing protein n=1 Tax=Sulfurirhabdus autotrophica TaxID=1706046 RepID=A0A4R3Y1I9_9PROT|nr:hypothetical protein [Sulfurirhabdus autotrophica]TCV85141.1 hypothetical protein EDC63_11030 [Sulfurirhabdus autotrophica]
MRARFIFHIWLVFLLLFAQGSALAHSISHFSEPLPFQSKSDKQLPHGPACDKCMFYADMAGAIPAMASLLPVPQLALNQNFPQYKSFVSILDFFYSSRAPPVLG